MKDYQLDMLLATVPGVAILIAGAWVFAVIVRRRMAERQEVRRAILEKLSSEELLRLLENEGGRTWLRDVLAGPNDARAGIERAMQMLFAGIGCGVAAAFLHIRSLGAFGVILVAASVGQLVALAFLSKRRDAQ